MICAISKDELVEAVDEIFSSMAGMQLIPSDTTVRPDKDAGYIVSVVQIVGVWQGAVRLDIDIGLARQACLSPTPDRSPRRCRNRPLPPT